MECTLVVVADGAEAVVTREAENRVLGSRHIVGNDVIANCRGGEVPHLNRAASPCGSCVSNDTVPGDQVRGMRPDCDPATLRGEVANDIVGFYDTG